jgi:GntR family transcriptional regulator/MocR family aminotransferase
VPLYRQIYRSLRAAILAGRLEAGTRLPSTRAVALELGVARNTVIAVFEQLADEGFVYSRIGDGTRIAEVEPEFIRRSLQSARKRPFPTRDSPPGGGSARRGAQLSARGEAIAAVRRGSVALGAFQTGLPDFASFPHRVWARILARHTRAPEPERLGYGDAAGAPRLRSAISAYVAAARGVNCSPERVVVVTGAQAALDLRAGATITTEVVAQL